MDFTMLTSVGQYIKTLKLQTTWQLKQEKGDYTGHRASLEQWLGESVGTGASSWEERHTGDSKLQSIQMKVFHGRTLTLKEKEYLRAKDPETYEKAKQLEREKKAYEDALKRCRTKEEVQRLKLSRVGASLSAVNAIKNNPHISKSDKLALMMMENGKVAAAERATREFVRGGDYQRLPSELEGQAQRGSDWVVHRRPDRQEEAPQQEPSPPDSSLPSPDHFIPSSPDGTPSEAAKTVRVKAQSAPQESAASAPRPRRRLDRQA